MAADKFRPIPVFFNAKISNYNVYNGDDYIYIGYTYET